MAAAALGNGAPSLPPPRPKSPPDYPDLYGKRRELAKVQMLEREISFLEEELKSAEGLPPASRSCKEVADFVMANADPLIPTKKKVSRSRRCWKWICGMSCFNLSWICCCCGCSRPKCCKCNCCTCSCSCSNPCAKCRMPKCNCCSCWSSQCFCKSNCNWSCCIPKCPSCSNCCSFKCTCYPRCPKVNISSWCCCTKKCCCFPCYLCC